MASQGLASVSISVTTLDETLARKMEPRAPAPKRRLQMIRRLAEAGIPVRIQVSPLIPALTDHELEAVMVAFANGEYDVLLCTSIIESGLDLPNVNTILIDRADTFGLAQLYQLRGRVGRGASRGYAYFFHPRTTSLTMKFSSFSANSGSRSASSASARNLAIWRDSRVGSAGGNP